MIDLFPSLIITGEVTQWSATAIGKHAGNSFSKHDLYDSDSTWTTAYYNLIQTAQVSYNINAQNFTSKINCVRTLLLMKHETDKSVALLEDFITEPLDEMKAIEVAFRTLSQACRLGIASDDGQGQGQGQDPDRMVDLYIISSSVDNKQSIARRTMSI